MSSELKSVELQKSSSFPNTLQIIDELIISNGCPENCMKLFTQRSVDVKK